MNTYDVIIIGGGPGGYLAADIIGKAGKKCLLIEKNVVGGVCLNEGCIPTKSILNAAKSYKSATQGEFLDNQDIKLKFNHKAVIAQKNETVKILVRGVESTLKKNKVKVLYAEAEIIARTESGSVIRAGNIDYLANNLIIASGSQSIIPPIAGVETLIGLGKILNSREILNITEVPQNLVIVGGGYIGLEMASYFNTAGSHVVIVEMEEHIAGTLDKEISNILKEDMTSQGIVFYTSSRVISISKDKVFCINNGNNFELPYTHVLLSAGRKPTFVKGTSVLGIKEESSGIFIDDTCRTNINGVYALGDVTNKMMLAHVAYRQAEVVANNILDHKDFIDYSAVPTVMYTQPEVGWVGLSEAEAVNQGYSYTAKKISINASGRHVIENGLTKGICKLIIDDKRGVVIGGGLIGSYASEIIYTISLIVHNKIPIENLKNTIFPHPTVCEVIKELIRA